MPDERPTPYERHLRTAMNAMMKIYQDPEGDPREQIQALQRHVRFIDGLLSAKYQEGTHDRRDTDDTDA